MSAELTVVTALLAGFFGSTHCIGMCGAIVVLIEGQSAAQQRTIWIRRISYNCGRLCFYALLGSVAALSGTVLTKSLGVSAGLTVLRMLAAFLVIAIGLNLLFDWRLTRFLESTGAGLWRHVSHLTRYVLPATNVARALGAGFVWGALPCGLVYSAVALASTTGSFSQGALVMFAFWLGTLPALLAIGASAERIAAWRTRVWLRRTAGMIVIVLGVLALLPLALNRDSAHQHGATQRTDSFLEFWTRF